MINPGLIKWCVLSVAMILNIMMKLGPVIFVVIGDHGIHQKKKD